MTGVSTLLALSCNKFTNPSSTETVPTELLKATCTSDASFRVCRQSSLSALGPVVEWGALRGAKGRACLEAGPLLEPAEAPGCSGHTCVGAGVPWVLPFPWLADRPASGARSPLWPVYSPFQFTGQTGKGGDLGRGRMSEITNNTVAPQSNRR